MISPYRTKLLSALTIVTCIVVTLVKLVVRMVCSFYVFKNLPFTTYKAKRLYKISLFETCLKDFKSI